MRFDQIFHHKHDIHFLYGKLSTKLLKEAAKANFKFMFTKKVFIA